MVLNIYQLISYLNGLQTIVYIIMRWSSAILSVGHRRATENLHSKASFVFEEVSRFIWHLTQFDQMKCEF